MKAKIKAISLYPDILEKLERLANLSTHGNTSLLITNLINKEFERMKKYNENRV